MPITTPTQQNRLAEVWTGDASFATTLLVMFIDAYGTEALEWHPSTIRAEINDDFRIKLPQVNFDRLMAAIALLKNNTFYTSVPSFIQLCNILDGDTYDPRAWDPADSMEMAWGITEAMLISPPEEGDDEPFSPEIRGYIGAVLNEEGITNPPDVLQIALREPGGQNVPGEFSDDPDMFAAISQMETDKTEAIQNGVRTRLQLLSRQLDSLPLREGDTKDVVQRMLRSLS